MGLAALITWLIAAFVRPYLLAATTATLRAHRMAQLAERMTAGPDWKDGDFAWC